MYVVEKSNDEFSACLGLLDRFFRARVNYYWPGELISPGIINGPANNALIWNIEHEMEENARKTRESETEIVRVAREMGLSPQPSGTGPGHWMARCPESNHHLYINAETNSFGCGWCKRKGSVEELRAFVVERKQREPE